MSEWTPPASGTPCWLNIGAQDVQRARKFYESVFNWNFQESQPPNPKYTPDKIAFFSVPDKAASPGGAISKTEKSMHAKLETQNMGEASLYLYADDLVGYMEKIVKAGGKKGSDAVPEGEHGHLQHFYDTEGNYMGIYQAGPLKQ